MRRCDYCDATFTNETKYLEHLRDEHDDELGAIERRRVASLDSGRETSPLVYAAGLGALALIALVAYLVFFTGGSGASEPYANNQVHYHGAIEVTIDGQTLDFSQPEYQYGQTNDPHFHFEGGDGDQWHVHSKGVTLAYAMGTLGIDVTDETVAFEGTTYRDDDPDTEVVVAVNGNDVDPESYVLQEGDEIRIVAQQN